MKTRKKADDTLRQAEAPRRAPGQAGVDFGELEQLLDFMNQHGLEEVEYARGDLHVRLRKASAHGSRGAAPFPPPEIVVAAGTQANPAVGAENPAPAREAQPETGRAEDLHVVKSPIVGTYYEGPSPGAPAFVKGGDAVTAGQVLCIIEAMKLMNEIESDVAGEIVRIYAENGQPVEYGQPLFAIRPARKK